MKYKIRVKALMVVALVICTIQSHVVSANSDIFENSTQYIIEDSVRESSDDLEISPLSEKFIEAQKSGVKESPLNINFDFSRVNIRSMSEQLPSSYDLRLLNRVTPVKDQGKNGSCWAFATYGSMESVLSQYGDFDLSEKHLRNTHGFDWGPNDGGNRDIATAYMSRGDGPIREKDDPYDPVISVSPENLERILDIDKVLYLPDVYSFNDTKDLKRAIKNHGGIYTVINSSNYYQNKDNNSYYNPGGGSSDHAITIVGWDDNFPKEMFNSRPQNDGAWICKNSWGTDYMEEGYFYVSYYDYHVGKNNAIFIPKKKDENGRIYQHDPFGATRSVGYNKKGYIANVFTADGEETLHEVGLYNVSMMTDYTVYLVRNVSRTSQLVNDRVEIAKGMFQYPGYYTIDVESAQLKEGEQFAIVVYMNSEKANYRYPLPIETSIEGFSSNAKADRGQSYVSSDGTKWSDLTDELSNANACIKAITTSGEILKDDDLIPENPENPSDIIEEVKNIYFKEGTAGYLRINEKGKITPILEPSHLENTKIDFKSFNPEVAEIDSDGVITPRRVGTVNLSAEIKVSKGILRTKFILDILPKDLKNSGSNPIPVVGENDYVEVPDTPDDINPEIPKPYEDPNIPRRLYLTVPEKQLVEGESFNLSEVCMAYPETAISDIEFIAEENDSIEMDDTGKVTAIKQGIATIKIRSKSNNKLQKTLQILVLPKFENHELKLTRFEVSDRSVGCFTVNFSAIQNGVGYSGPAEVITTAGNDKFGKVTKIKTIYFDKGEASIRYNGGQFGVWRTNFETIIKLRDIEDMVKYEFSKDSKSPCYYAELPKYVELEKNNIEIREIIVSDRKSGIFSIESIVEKNGLPYSGEAIITTTTDKSFKSNTVEFIDGKASIKYNGIHFPIREYEFNTEIKIEDTSRLFSYQKENV